VRLAALNLRRSQGGSGGSGLDPGIPGILVVSLNSRVLTFCLNATFCVNHVEFSHFIDSSETVDSKGAWVVVHGDHF